MTQLNHRYVIVSVTLALIVALQPVHAQKQISPFSRFAHTSWQTNEGLPQNSVNAIVQSRDGYIWFGTEEGLVRFDGVKFTVFDKRNTKALTINFILSLCEASDSALWIGTNGGGVTKLKNGQFSTYTVEQGLSDNIVRSIVEDREGSLWFGTSKGVTRLKDGRFTPYSNELGFTYSWINRLLIDRDGTLWVGTNGGGLHHFVNGNGTPLISSDELYGNVIMALHEDTSGNLWVGAEKGTLTRVSGGALRTFTLKGIRGAISAVLKDREGAVWVGTEDGSLAQFIEPDSLMFFSRGGSPISSLLEDMEGNLWVGKAGGGLHRIKRGKFTTYTERDGLPGDFVQVISPAPDGSVWVGSMGGLSRYSGYAFTQYLSNEQLPIEGIAALHSSSDGTLWVGTSYGLSSIRNGECRSYTITQGASKGGVRGIAEDREGRLLLTTRMGLLVSTRPTDSKPTFRPYGDSASALCQPLWSIGVSRHTGDIWVSMISAGLVRISLSGSSTKETVYSTRDGLPNNAIRSIYEDHEGTMWFGTFAGGLTRFKNGKFTVYNVNDGLFDDNVFTILEDDRGNLWMSCNVGVFRVSKSQLNDFADGRIRSISCVSYGTADGMRTFECNGGYQPSGCKSDDGRLWFATIQGAAVINPDNIEENSFPPPVVIERAVIDKRSVDQNGEANIEPGNGELEFTYTALSFVAPERVRFRYRLEGFDADWIDAHDRRAAYYTNISPGTYTFRVVASNNDGVWNETGDSFTFHLAPHFYQTLWFYALCILVTAFVGSLIYHFYHAYKDREKVASRLQAQLAQAELQVLKMQLQPHFLFNTLHAISSLMHKDLEAADEMMARLGDLLRYTLENNGVQEVELGQEMEILDHYLEIEHIRLVDRLAITKNVPPELLSVIVPNLILQPIVENAVRYAVAPRASGGCVEIAACQVGQNIRLTVCDDGPGIPERLKEGVGISNTRARLEQLYGTNQRFVYANRSEGGVCVTLEFPLRIEAHANHNATLKPRFEGANTHR